MYTYNYSIIIPHYNIPDLLLRCINSIPVREDVQVIVVDDCSPCQQRTFEMLKALRLSNLEWYSTPCGGSAGRARNIGLDHAKGKWLVFIDADDLFSKDVSAIFDKSVGFKEDILFYNTIAVMNDDLEQTSNRNLYSNYFDHYDDERYNLNFRYVFHSLWGKIFKSELIMKHGIRFDHTRYSNDAFFSFMSGVYANKIYKSQQVLYVVTEREGSLASSETQNRVYSLEECKTRLYVALKIYDKNKIYKINAPIYDVFTYLEKIRENYKLYYVYIMIKLFFTHPCVAYKELNIARYTLFGF